MDYQEHSQTTLDWRISDVAVLCAQVEEGGTSVLEAEEGTSENPVEVHDVLRRGLITSDAAYKLDLALTSPNSTATLDPPPLNPQTLSLFITASHLESLTIDMVFPITIFVGVKHASYRPQTGTAQWIWTKTIEIDFCQATEYAECILPSLSSLLQDPIVKMSDAFSICVQIRSYETIQPFQQPNQAVIPRSMVNALAKLIDTATGDVTFVCLEHAAPASKAKGETLSRKRTILAHSYILKERSEYFRDLLESGFRESREGKLTVVVDDAAFDTVYWMLRFIYTNELELDPSLDVHHILLDAHLDKNELNRFLQSKSLGSSTWEYRRLPLEGEDMEPQAVSPATSVLGSRRQSALSPTPAPAKARPRSSSVTSRTSSTTSARTSKPSPRVQPEPDPHLHPCAAPSPASALSIYMLALRYRLDDLTELAKNHILDKLSLKNCITMLLATHAYDELHDEVLEYVLEHWQQVKESHEFVEGFRDATHGVWGEASQALMGLFKRL
ncbi:hypothetical protein P7C73_g413, partial [Tremellales sp. Uapishka_1]